MSHSNTCGKSILEEGVRAKVLRGQHVWRREKGRPLHPSPLLSCPTGAGARAAPAPSLDHHGTLSQGQSFLLS